MIIGHWLADVGEIVQKKAKASAVQDWVQEGPSGRKGEEEGRKGG